MKTIAFLVIASCFVFCLQKNKTSTKGEIKISWLNNFSEDFSFKDLWSYNEGIYRNHHGQLSCDAFCSEEMDRMKDTDGKIYKDSLVAFYKLLDTTHKFHSIKSEVISQEYFNTNFITVRKINDTTIIAFTENNSSTHARLHLTIVNNRCTPVIELKSIVYSADKEVYPVANGKIQIDKNLWEQGIMKAKFDFTFKNMQDTKNKLNWRGKIFSKILVDH